MHGIGAALGSSDVDSTFLEVDVIPVERDELGDAQPMTIGHKDQRRISMSMPTRCPGRANERVNLIRR
jgi:hypothetical protein